MINASLLASSFGSGKSGAERRPISKIVVNASEIFS